MFAAGLGAGLAALMVLEMLAQTDRELFWPFISADERTATHRFLDQMSAHHAVGVQLARLAALRAVDPELQRLGRLMVANQAREAEIIERW